MHIEIPKDLLNEFGQKDLSTDEAAEGTELSKPGERTPLERAKLKAVKKFGIWLSTSFDSNMKNIEAPGLSGVTPEEFVELGVTAWEEELLKSDWIEDLPKYAFGVTMLSIAGANGAAIIRNKRKKESETNSGNAGEQPDEVGSKAAKGSKSE